MQLRVFSAPISIFNAVAYSENLEESGWGVTVLGSPADDSPIDALLDILIPSANRWPSLCIKLADTEVLDNIMGKFNCLEFPCLEDIFMDDYQHFLSPEYSSALGRLYLGKV